MKNLLLEVKKETKEIKYISDVRGLPLTLVVNGHNLVNIREFSADNYGKHRFELDLCFGDEKNLDLVLVSGATFYPSDTLQGALQNGVGFLKQARKYDEKISIKNWTFFNGLYCLSWADDFGFNVDPCPEGVEEDENISGLSILVGDESIYYEIYGGIEKVTEILNDYLCKFQE